MLDGSRFKCAGRCQEDGVPVLGNRSRDGGVQGLATTRRREERNEPKLNRRRWRRLVDERRSRGKLAVGLDLLGLDHKTMEVYAGKKMHAKKLLEAAATALKLGKRSARRVATQRRGWPTNSIPGWWRS